MKPMDIPGAYEKAVAGICGLAGGCLAYLKAHMAFMGIWGIVGDKAMSLAWAGTVALFSGAMGVLGKRLIEKIFKKKR